MFQFRRFPTQCYFIHKELTEYCSAGFPHSEIHGSLPAFDFPWLIVDRYVLHRLPMPRHPPCALLSLTFSELCVLMFVNFSTRLYCSIFTHLTIVKSFEYLLHYLVVSISHYLYSVFKVHLQAFPTCLVGSRGLEPPTSRLSGVRSNHLSYEPKSWFIRSLTVPFEPLVEISGIEPLTPCLQSRCSPS